MEPVMLADGVIDGVSADVSLDVGGDVGDTEPVGELVAVPELEAVAVSDAGVYVAVGVLCGELPPV